MKLPTSMWSGQMRCSAPPSLSRPWTVITFEPMPSILAPIFTSRRARSWTCGSDAAFEIVVGPGVRAAAINAFSVPITDGSSMKTAQGLSPPTGALISIMREPVDLGAHVDESVEVRVQATAADEVAARRGHAGLAEAGQQRPGEQEGRADPRGERLVGRDVGDAVGLKP